MIALDDVEFLRGQRVRYFWRPVPWEDAISEDAILLGRTAHRIRILHLNATDAGDQVKLVTPESLYEVPA